MRVIQKALSLESLTSRLPGVAPAYVPGSNEPIFFDEGSLSGREYTYLSNYGLVPMSVRIGDKCLSWERISELYHFFTDYYHLLNDWSHCGLVYESADDFYLGETKNGRTDSLPYGSLEDTYIELDDRYNEYGGESTFNEIKKLIPYMDVPKEFSDEWDTTKLYYPDYLKWRGWFMTRYPKYSGYTDSNSCSAATYCCDCTEYFKRGGNVMYSAFTATTFDLPTPPLEEYEDGYLCTRDRRWCFCKTDIILPVSLQVSIDDIGEFSIFSEEYKLGVDYRVANYGDSENTIGGTVASIDGKSMKLKNGGYNGFRCKTCGYTSDKDFNICPKCGGITKESIIMPRYGFRFDETYMEKYLAKEDDTDELLDWETYDGSGEDDETRYYQSETQTGFYSFRGDYSKVYGSSEEEVRLNMNEKYELTKLDSVLYAGDFIPVYNEEIGYYNGDENRKYHVYRDLYTDTPYVTINGKRIYASPNKGAKDIYEYFYFPFFYPVGVTPSKGGVCNYASSNNYQFYPRMRKSSTITEDFVTYGGVQYSVSNTEAVINGNHCPRVKGYLYNQYGTYYVDVNNYVVNYYTREVSSEYTYNPSTNIVTRHSNDTVKVYSFGNTTGTTTSKLRDMASTDVLIDDVGNRIEGKRPTNQKSNHQPDEGEELELLYEVGNVSRRISKFEGLTTDNIDETVNYFYGNIITSMTFYFKDYFENVYEVKEWNGSSLSTIKSMDYDSASEEALSAGTVLMEGIFCDVEYHIGATIKRELGSNKYTLAYNSDNSYCPGVKYKETVRFIKDDVQYVLRNASSGSIPMVRDNIEYNNLSYPITIYRLVQDENNEGNVIVEFEFEMPPVGDWKGYGGNIQIFPVIRQEYNMGNSIMQKVEGDIYIDRGINAAFEKHIKLGEVTSLEDLEQYGNGYFKFEK